MRRATSASSLTGGRDQSQNLLDQRGRRLASRCAGGKVWGGERKKPLQQIWAGSPDTSQQPTSRRASGLNMGLEGAKFDLGFVAWEFKIELDMLVQLRSLSLCLSLSL